MTEQEAINAIIASTDLLMRSSFSAKEIITQEVVDLSNKKLIEFISSL